MPLSIPPVLAPTRTSANHDFYELTQRVATREILPGVPTRIWGYDGIFPGPTIISRAGRRTVVRHHNRLPVPTVTHLHGGIDANPALGAVEIWRFTTDFDHPIHLHLTHFQVLARGNHPPGPYDQGWKDTINLSAAEQAAVIARFTDHPGRYVFHCHNLEHEDMAMMATFELT